MSATIRTQGGASRAAAVPGGDLEAAQAALEPTRLSILFLLARRGPMCVGDIAGGFKITRPAVSHHLKVLRTSGFVRRERVGQEIHYTALMGPIVELLRSLADAIEQCCSNEPTA